MALLVFLTGLTGKYFLFFHYPPIAVIDTNKADFSTKSPFLLSPADKLWIG